MTREMFVKLIMRVFPKSEFPQISEIKSIPGYDTSTDIGQDVLVLYNAGVLTGTNQYGVFAPYTPVSRAEIATLLCRIIQSDKRVAISLEPAPDDCTSNQAIPLDTNGLTITGFDGTYIYAYRSKTEEYGVFNLNGEQIIGWKKGFINKASEGIFRIADRATGEVTYYNAQDERLNATSFFGGTDFSDGFAAVQAKDGVVHIINVDGKIIRTFNLSGYKLYDKSLSGGYLKPAEMQNVLIDIETGKVIELPYFEISGFYKGLARVINHDEGNGASANIINMDLEELFSQDYKYIYWGDGYFPVTNDNTRWGIADTQGNLVVPMDYSSIEANSVGLGLFTRQGSLTLRSMDTGKAVMELPLSSGVEYELYDKYLIRLTHKYGVLQASGSEGTRTGTDISVFDFGGYEIFRKTDVPDYLLSENGIVYMGQDSLYYFNVS